MSQVIDPKDLDNLIRFHQDSISAYAGFISPSGRYLEEQTVKVLQHYRNLIVTTPDCQKSAENPHD